MSVRFTDLDRLLRFKRRAIQLGLVFFVIAIIVFVYELDFVRRANATMAQLTWVAMDEISAPVLEYTTAKGEFKSIVAQDSNLFYNYTEGMRASLLYDPQQPERVKFNHFVILWAGASFFFCITVACFAFAYLLQRLISLMQVKSKQSAYK